MTTPQLPNLRVAVQQRRRRGAVVDGVYFPAWWPERWRTRRAMAVSWTVVGLLALSELA
jgi:hypothetical protein